MSEWVCTYGNCREKGIYQWWDDHRVRFYTCRQHSLAVCDMYNEINHLPSEQWHLRPKIRNQLEATASQGMK
jgi:hypothetical protein